MKLKLLFLKVVMLYCLVLHAQTPAETTSITTDLTLTTHAINGADFPTAIVTYKGVIYYGYIDANLNGCIARKDVNGNITTAIVMTGMTADDNHNEVSIAVDAEGYIHWTGNMHQTPMVYYRSAQPESISNFIMLNSDVANGGISGPIAVSYGRFIQSRKGTLFYISRQRVNTVSEGWVPGNMAGNIQVYNTDTKRWSQLGSLDYTFTGDRGQTITGGMDANHQTKAVFWDLSGAGAPPNNAYQGYKIRIVFDNNNRMHMVWNVAKNPVRTTVSDTHTHLMYAYSDDEGITWKRSNGTTLSLPIATANGEVVYMEDPNVNAQRMYNFCNIMFGNDNQPTILQQSYTQNKMLAFRLTGGNWVDVSSTINSAWPGEGYNDGNGWITFPAGSSTFRRTNDNAGTWLSYPNLTSNTGSHSVDYQYLYETGKVRYQRVTGTSTSVHTITFSGSTGGQVAQPEISIVSGSSFNINTSATITCPTPNTTIRYTTDGSLPTATNGTVYTGPITINNSVTLKARAFHNTKTESRLAASQIIIIGDSQAPGTPQSLNSSAITSSSFSLSWQASSDNVGVTGYEIFRNGVSIANVTGTSYNATGLNASTTYSMAVRAYDAAGNNSSLSTALNVTTQAAVSTYRYLRLVAQGTVGLDVTLQSINWLVNTATYPNPRIDNTSSSRVAANVSLTNAWRAYDNSLTSGWTIASNFPATIDVDLGAGNGITPTGIEIDANSANRGLSAFMCYGSNDNTNWTLLHTSSGLTSSHYPNSIGTFTFNNNNQSYSDERKTPFLAYQKQDDDFLNAYPNPTKDIIYVNQDAAKCFLTLYTLTGTQLYQKQGNFLNLAELPDGIYLLKITVNEKINFKKIILTK